jgi:hypothetical protein
MVAAESNLVTFRHGPLSAGIVARAEADAVAQFDLRRGFRLSAEAKATLQQHLDAQLGAEPQQRSAAAAVDASRGPSTLVRYGAALWSIETIAS